MLKLVIEYHYSDGDIGAYPAGREAQALWTLFDPVKTKESEPTHIIIRPAKEGE